MSLEDGVSSKEKYNVKTHNPPVGEKTQRTTQNGWIKPKSGKKK